MIFTTAFKYLKIIIMSNKLYNLVGLAAKARYVRVGAYACENAVKRGYVSLVLLNPSASQNTMKDFTNLCKYYNNRIIILENKNMLGRALGKEGIKVAGITDENLAREIIKIANSNPGDD